ncbi:hypothetical protein CDAR_473961 [Caerostris darwini]|uniref:Uncharacterized protein n=1 Tax=Caerostris darwini TaxID=1538125 RepID=A0AAV4SJQ2_9ARAC|nr:hypothetical protein CDAR_473871 [Caerostris darwini]GIY33436.1 hypothetical protein CDAR_473961 [Caerostris darwini]
MHHCSANVQQIQHYLGQIGCIVTHILSKYPAGHNFVTLPARRRQIFLYMPLARLPQEWKNAPWGVSQCLRYHPLSVKSYAFLFRFRIPNDSSVVETLFFSSPPKDHDHMKF